MEWLVDHEFCLKSVEICIPFKGTDKEAEIRFANLVGFADLKLYKKVDGKVKDVTPPKPVQQKLKKLIYQHN